MQPIWTPSAARIARANLSRFIAQVRELGERTASITDYDTLYEWSTRDLEQFWLEVVRFCGVVSDAGRPGLACERLLIGLAAAATLE